MAQLDRSEGLVGNTAFKSPVRAATTANITLSAEQTIDGIACVADDRVLVKNQTTGSENGIWVVSTGSWNRSDDFDGSYDCTTGTMVRCVSGTVNANSVWKLDTTGTITIGTTSLTFTAASVGFDAQGMADFIHAATQKATIVDADECSLADSAASWLLKKFTFTNLWTWIRTHADTTYAALAGSASQAFTASTFTGAFNSGESTVTGHATTADIFGSAENSVLFDDAGGAITVTAIPAASKAGLTRDVRYNGATKYTAGANLIIEGIPSGTTITLASGATAKFRAITTTQFKMTYSVSGTFTATGTGFTVNPTTTAKYKVENGVAQLSIPTAAITGTSNTTAFTITGLPTCLSPVTDKVSGMMRATDSTSGVYAYCTIIGGTTTITLANGTGGATSWTASGTKNLVSSELVFLLS